MAVIEGQLEKVLLSDYQKLQRENWELKQELTKLKLEMEGMKRAIKVLAKSIDDTDAELGFRATTEQKIEKLIEV